MRLIHTSFVVLVTLIVLAMAVPAAQARPIEKPQPAAHVQSGSWLDSAMNWLARLAGNEPGLTGRMMNLTTTPPPMATAGPYYAPLSGPCVDPMGVGRCNV